MKRNAMTLVEILLTTVLFLLVISMVIPIYRLSFSVDKKLRVDSEAVKNSVLLLSKINTDLKVSTEIWITKRPTSSKPVRIYTNSTDYIEYYLDNYYTNTGKVVRFIKSGSSNASNTVARNVYDFQFLSNYSGVTLNYLDVKVKISAYDRYSKTNKQVSFSRIIYLPNNPTFYSY